MYECEVMFTGSKRLGLWRVPRPCVTSARRVGAIHVDLFSSFAGITIAAAARVASQKGDVSPFTTLPLSMLCASSESPTQHLQSLAVSPVDPSEADTTAECPLAASSRPTRNGW